MPCAPRVTCKASGETAGLSHGRGLRPRRPSGAARRRGQGQVGQKAEIGWDGGGQVGTHSDQAASARAEADLADTTRRANCPRAAQPPRRTHGRRRATAQRSTAAPQHRGPALTARSRRARPAATPPWRAWKGCAAGPARTLRAPNATLSPRRQRQRQRRGARLQL